MSPGCTTSDLDTVGATKSAVCGETALGGGAFTTVRLDLLFEALCDGLRDGTFHGCPFANAVTELPDSQPVREVAMRHRRAVLAHVAGILGVGPESPIANRIVLLYDGAIVSTKVTSACEGIDEARQLVRELVDGQAIDSR